MFNRAMKFCAGALAAGFMLGGVLVTPVAEAQSLPCPVYCRRGCIQQYGLPQNNPAFEACFAECLETDCSAGR